MHINALICITCEILKIALPIHHDIARKNQPCKKQRPRISHVQCDSQVITTALFHL